MGVKRRLQSERGQSVIELVLILPLLVAIFAILVFFGRVLYVRLAVEQASFDGARAAIESLNAGRGPDQGYATAYATLQGWRLSPGHGAVRLYYNDWDRGTGLTCRVGYKVRVSDIPLVGWFYSGGGGVRVQAATTLRVEQYKSRWD